MTEIGLIGAGRLGRSLVTALPANSFRIGAVRCRDWVSARKAVREMRLGEPSESYDDFTVANIVLVAVPDDAVEGVLGELLQASAGLQGKTVLHTAGYCDPAWLERFAEQGVELGCLFPLQLFQRLTADLRGTYFAVAGGPLATAEARRLIRAWGGQYSRVKPEGIASIATGMSLFGDGLTALLELTQRCLTAGGVQRKRALEALLPGLQTCYDDYIRSGRASRPGAVTRRESVALERRWEGLRASDAKSARQVQAAFDLIAPILGVKNETLDRLPDARPSARAHSAGGG